jgi:hypothetical protein
MDDSLGQPLGEVHGVDVLPDAASKPLERGRVHVATASHSGLGTQRRHIAARSGLALLELGKELLLLLWIQPSHDGPDLFGVCGHR